MSQSGSRSISAAVSIWRSTSHVFPSSPYLSLCQYGSYITYVRSASNMLIAWTGPSKKLGANLESATGFLYPRPAAKKLSLCSVQVMHLESCKNLILQLLGNLLSLTTWLCPTEASGVVVKCLGTSAFAGWERTAHLFFSPADFALPACR